MPILDQNGRPLSKSAAREEVQRRAGDRPRALPEQPDLHRHVAPGIDPGRLAQILRSNDCGDNIDFLTLCEEMEERDPEYYSRLQTRKNAVVHVPLALEPKKRATSDKLAVKIAEAGQEELIDRPEFRWWLNDLMDALGKGYAVTQPLWDFSDLSMFRVKEYHFYDQRSFQFDKETFRELRLRDPKNTEGRPLPKDFIAHYPRIRSGVKLRGGLARLAVVTWLFKTCTVTDWLAFAEVYGMPIRLGRYNAGAVSEDELATLHTALVNLGHDAAAMIPDSMKIEFPDARRPTSGDNIYKGLADYFDGQLGKAILGQILALDSRATGLGQAVADLHNAVRQDIRESDALALRATVEPLIKLWVQLNYGPDAPVPRLVINIRPPKDLGEFTKAILPWMQHAGLEVPRKWLFDQLQIPIPEEGEDTIKAPLAPGTPGSGAPVPGLKST